MPSAPHPTPYEPAEAQYGLTRQILEALAEFRNPASITTKGALVRRDVDVLRRLNEVAGVQVVFSVGTIDETVWRQTEPGAPHPMARLEAMQYLVEHDVPAGVLAAPLLPGLSDSADSINALVAAAAAHRAQFLSGNLLFLRPGSREWFMPFIRDIRIWPPVTRGCIAANTRRAITLTPYWVWWMMPGSAGNCPVCPRCGACNPPSCPALPRQWPRKINCRY